jgi:ABC-2 type transport system permease protein
LSENANTAGFSGAGSKVSPPVVLILTKELRDLCRGVRFALLLGIILLSSIAAAWEACRNMRRAIEALGENDAFLLIFTYKGGILPSVVGFLGFLGPIAGLLLGFDAISGERARASLVRILSRPLYRDTLINAKFLAGAAAVSAISVCVGLELAGLGILYTGLTPTPDETLRIALFIVVTIVYISFWLAVSLLLSVMFRRESASSLCGMGIWLFMSIFIGILARGTAGFVYPEGGQGAEHLEYLLTRISPSVLYNEAVNVLLNPLIRSVGPITSEQLEGMIPGALPTGQGLLLIWPHVIGIMAAGTICFAAAYILFSRQEIRT